MSLHQLLVHPKERRPHIISTAGWPQGKTWSQAVQSAALASCGMRKATAARRVMVGSESFMIAAKLRVQRIGLRK